MQSILLAVGVGNTITAEQQRQIKAINSAGLHLCQYLLTIISASLSPALQRRRKPLPSFCLIGRLFRQRAITGSGVETSRDTQELRNQVRGRCSLRLTVLLQEAANRGLKYSAKLCFQMNICKVFRILLGSSQDNRRVFPGHCSTFSCCGGSVLGSSETPLVGK